MTRRASPSIKQLSARARQLEKKYVVELRKPTACRRLEKLTEEMAAATDRQLNPPEFVKQFAQAVACAEMALRICRWQPNSKPQGESANWFDHVLAECEHSGDGPDRWPGSAEPDISLTHFYEQYLQTFQAGQKSQFGVFYTPRPVVGFIVRELDRVLRQEFGCADGLADTATWGQVSDRFPGLAMPPHADRSQPFVRILDPALGTGAFLIEVIAVIHRTMTAKWQSAGAPLEEIQARWSDYVPRHLLPRIFGFELLLPALVIACIQIVEKLRQTGYDGAGADLQLWLANTLADPPSAAAQGCDTGSSRQLSRAHAARCETPITVVLGNPPFAGISDQHGAWIKRLLRGGAGGRAGANYYQVDGTGLGERKLWLQDDYVKFFRYAQWCIERSGVGTVGFVTNHGYLDNATFRGMRQQLIRTFTRIDILDLHGNRKKKESPPSAGRDENVFSVEQGVAIGLFRRPPGSGPPTVAFRELWGDRAEKLAALEDLTDLAVTELAERNPPRPRRQPASNRPQPQTVQPRSPYYFFTPLDDALLAEYQRGVPLSVVMPVNSTLAVTARDHFVVAFDKQLLLQRMAEFRDLSIPDEQIRQRYFTNGRSKKYPPGDTRGWKLSQARQRMAADDNWRDYVQSCLYRPFDRRAIFWADWMVDWPRTPVMRQMKAGPNTALIARRQMLPTQSCNYFWVSDDITLDGVLRSDNRGSESLFPLYLYPGKTDPAPPGGTRRQSNLDADFVNRLVKAYAWTWQTDGAGDLQTSFGPEDVLAYLYAQFHSPSFRARYAAGLRIEFPRIFVPAKSALFRQLSRLGRQLVVCHQTSPGSDPLAAGRTAPITVGPGYPRFESGRIFVNSQQATAPVLPEVWRFHAGGHQVCRKWLRDRRHGGLDTTSWNEYPKLLAAIERTLTLMRRIDECVQASGGWPQAFLNR